MEILTNLDVLQEVEFKKGEDVICGIVAYIKLTPSKVFYGVLSDFSGEVEELTSELVRARGNVESYNNLL